MSLVGKNHYLEHREVYKNHEFVVLFNSGGYRTAYVEVSHTFLEKIDYMSCDNYIDVHGGFTYKECRLPFEQEELTDYTWLGWDYAHWCDGIDCETAEKLFPCEKRYFSYIEGHVYTLEEVISECKNVIDEITKRGVK